jgi:hypothetical protein
MLGGRVCTSYTAPCHTRTLLDALDQSQQPMALERKRELGHDDTLHRQRKRIGRGVRAGLIQQGGATHGQRKAQRRRVGRRKSALDDRDQRWFVAHAKLRLANTVTDAWLVTGSGERLRDAFEQGILRPNQKNDCHDFTSLYTLKGYQE